MNTETTLFRIYTESTGAKRHRAIAAVSERFDGFTVIDVEGHWEGTREASIIIEIIGCGAIGHGARFNVEAAARHIKRINDQDSVLVTETDIQGRLI